MGLAQPITPAPELTLPAPVVAPDVAYSVQAYLSDDRVAAICNCLALFNKGSQYNWCCVKNYWV